MSYLHCTVFSGRRTQTHNQIYFSKAPSRLSPKSHRNLRRAYLGTIREFREEFGVKESFLGLRNQSMKVVPLNVEKLHSKLDEILNLMNSKYSLNPENNVLLQKPIYEISG